MKSKVYFTYLFFFKEIVAGLSKHLKSWQRMIFISSELLTETWSPKTKQTKTKDIYKIL